MTDIDAIASDVLTAVSTLIAWITHARLFNSLLTLLHITSSWRRRLMMLMTRLQNGKNDDDLRVI